MNGTSSMMSPMSPSQKKAKDNLIGAIKTKAVPLVELRSPPALGRGYGVTFVLKAVAAELGAPLLGVATALECHDKSSDGQGQAIKRLYSATVASLEKHGVAVIDDLDLACDPRSVRRSRTLVGDIKGSGDIFNWEVAPSPAMLLKALSDAASSAGGVIVFSSVEDAHLAFIKALLFKREVVILSTCGGFGRSASRHSRSYSSFFPNSHAMGSCKTNRRTGAVGSPSELVGGWCPGHVLMASGSCDAGVPVSRSCFNCNPIML